MEKTDLPAFSGEQFDLLDIAKQARFRAAAFMLEKQVDFLFGRRHRVPPVDHIGSSGRTAQMKQVADLAKLFLESAGEYFIDRPGGTVHLIDLVARTTGWYKGSVLNAVQSHLVGYEINFVTQRITKKPEV